MEEEEGKDSRECVSSLRSRGKRKKNLRTSRKRHTSTAAFTLSFLPSSRLMHRISHNQPIKLNRT